MCVNLGILKISSCNRDFNKNFKLLFSINYNLFYRRIQHDVREKSTVHKLEKNAKNTLFTKIKVRLEEKW